MPFLVAVHRCRDCRLPLPPVRESLSLFMDVMAPKDESAGPIWSIDLQGR